MFDEISQSINQIQKQKQNQELRSRRPRGEKEREDRGDVEARNFTYRIGFFQQIINSQPGKQLQPHSPSFSGKIYIKEEKENDFERRFHCEWSRLCSIVVVELL